MLTINASGSPHEIGFEHGRQAAPLVARSITFYTGLFQKKSKMDWSQVRQTALKWVPHLDAHYPALAKEMKGLAEGAGVEYSDILALNIRTEIAFGMFSDGCTALSWKTEEKSFLGQNWDWMPAQKENLIIANIAQIGKPNISMVTEAGIIGKIGLNSAGVGVCLNAIRIQGCDFSRTPVHLCLRLILESTSLDAAVTAVEQYGCAAAAHMLIADPNGSMGLELTHKTVVKLPMDGKSRVFHSNHLLQTPSWVTDDGMALGDSKERVVRIRQLSDKLGAFPDEEDIKTVFTDEDGYPGSINRACEGKSESATLFNIVMDLTAKTADVIKGRPTDPDENIKLSFA
ncbi:peptidase C45 acyl-coenzyme A:6-aminopenicillanic acid acyl-transferas-like protein [Dacryopinax primogenitus]|uniref:Peptidase C45 acyl-coenzyme A:6-aminopenicillanic acid acyl-transferas-like protein n=1 Tax=Dacryopinax primogenitus (strain DJM 731) TaxID=1858805 RepID=M5FT54_DACPD|nr:peptidase C45 acyl-coenzyme A:6-aminopenicillanic acid acyl-transferas-like protein [Dacryopinax primogenitus]EJT98559.1 peptidase C45 acyl-coenzyme A:6-aminopenicillanic acid acyl-transferas-like protein [Dacryopinax primogenitus]